MADQNNYQGTIAPGYFKLRDQVHGGGQAGVPGNLRSIAQEEREMADQEEPQIIRNNKNPFINVEARRTLILRFLREHSGQTITWTELREAAKLKYSAGLQKYLDDLQEEGRITWKRTGRNVLQAKYIQPEQVNEYIIKAEDTTLPEPQPESQPPAPDFGTNNAAQFSQMMDREIWLFLRDTDFESEEIHTSLPEATKVLREFSRHLDQLK